VKAFNPSFTVAASFAKAPTLRWTPAADKSRSRTTPGKLRSIVRAAVRA